ncbi:MAG: hypothetical protein L3J09_11090 [Flavobacteriaceae bacterium]|nr:hypothetical protein [Flavobacteriaceae bacterium]
MNVKLIFVFLIIIPFSVFPQNNKTEAALYNIGLGSIGSGIGALINKKPHEKWNKVLVKGLWQGAIGGYLVYESKNILSKILEQKTWEYSWAAKMVNSAGTSIIENAASNRDFWVQWNINIGFNRIEFHTKDKFKVKYRIMPISVALFTVVALESKFEWKRTLQTGEIIFSTEDDKLPNVSATTLGNIVRFSNSSFNNFQTGAHEFIHIYQYYDYNFINAYYKKPLNKLANTSKSFNALNSIFYWDFHAGVLRSLYLLEGTNNACYFDNYFEHEAQFYSSGIFNCE